jgi:hypothetical protein
MADLAGQFLELLDQRGAASQADASAGRELVEASSLEELEEMLSHLRNLADHSFTRVLDFVLRNVAVTEEGAKLLHQLFAQLLGWIMEEKVSVEVATSVHQILTGKVGTGYR